MSNKKSLSDQERTLDVFSIFNGRIVPRYSSQIYVMLCAICYHLDNFENVKNIHGGVSLLVRLATLLKAILLHWYFSRFSDYTNGTKSRQVFHTVMMVN